MAPFCELQLGRGDLGVTDFSLPGKENVSAFISRRAVGRRGCRAFWSLFDDGNFNPFQVPRYGEFL